MVSDDMRADPTPTRPAVERASVINQGQNEVSGAGSEEAGSVNAGSLDAGVVSAPVDDAFGDAPTKSAGEGIDGPAALPSMTVSGFSECMVSRLRCVV
jgi:hypothetical protein